MRAFIVKIFFITTTLISFLSYGAVQEVEVVLSKQEKSHLNIELSGTIKAMNDAQLTSLEPGVVKIIKVDEGDHVSAGQVLIELDDSLAKIRLDQAKALYQSAEVKYQEDLRLYNEITELTEQKVTAKTLLAERKSNVANSKAMLAQTAATLKLQAEIVARHKLVAPFAGTIATRDIDVGEWVSQQSKVLQLVSDSTLRVFVDIPQEYFNLISKNTDIKVTVTPDTSSGSPIELSLTKFINVSNPTSRTFKARIDLPAKTTLVSGMSAKVQLSLPHQNASQVNLPKSSLKRHPDGSYSVYAVEQEKIKRFGVKLLKTDFNNVIVQGVPDGVQIIVSGNELLIEGTPVKAVQSKGVN